MTLTVECELSTEPGSWPSLRIHDSRQGITDLIVLDGVRAYEVLERRYRVSMEWVVDKRPNLIEIAKAVTRGGIDRDGRPPWHRRGKRSR